MDGLERYFGKDDELVIQLRDTVTVTAELEVRTDNGQRQLAQEQDRLEYEQRMKKPDACDCRFLQRFRTLQPGSSTAFALATDTFTLNATGSSELVLTCWTTGFPRPI
jgi:hypothetical protein